MNTIRINGLTVEFETGLEVIAEGTKVVIRKSVQPLNARARGIFPVAVAGNPVISMPTIHTHFPKAE